MPETLNETDQTNLDRDDGAEAEGEIQNQTETDQTDNLEADLEETENEGSEVSIVDSIKQKYGFKSEEEILKKLENQDKHINIIENENKALKGIREGALDSTERLRNLVKEDPKLAKEASKLSEALNPIIGNYAQEKAIENDRKEFEKTMEKYPDLADQKEALYAIGRVSNASWEDVIQYGKTLIGIGAQTGETTAKQKLGLKTGSNATRPPKPEGAVWTRSKVNKLSLDEYAKHKAEIDQAIREGKYDFNN